MEAKKWYIGRALKTIREKQGLTQRDLALKSGVGEATIGHAEQDFSQPTIGFVREIECALALQPGELYLRGYPESERLPQSPRPRGRPPKKAPKEKEAGP